MGMPSRRHPAPSSLIILTDVPAAIYTTARLSVFKRLQEEIAGVKARDPAARSTLEIVLCYPGLHAVLLYRLANSLWRGGWPLAGRFVSHLARLFTGIEIHPGATIGRGFFIDHGMGVVIGETAEIGNNVHLYHAVTLGGTSLSKGKRHPTVGDDVIIGAGAKILGAITVGKGARIGANAVVVGDVAPGATMVGIPARAVVPKEKDRFMAYGTPCSDIPDPVARALGALMEQVRLLQARLDVVEQEAARHDIPLPPVGEDDRAKIDASPC